MGGAQLPGAYAAIEVFQAAGLEQWPSVPALLAEAAGMRENQELFELYVSEYLQLTRCQVRPRRRLFRQGKAAVTRLPAPWRTGLPLPLAT